VDLQAARVVAALRESGTSLATAESLTGGLLCAALTGVPGASAVVLGGVVAYSVELKAAVLGVPRDLLEAQGAVAADTASAMAAGVRRVSGASLGVATTGVAGPDPSEGKPVGTVFVAVSAGESLGQVRALTLHGSREQIRRRTVESALDLVLETLAGTTRSR
jgi:nicotinamide-nucleotide amidase